MKGKSKIVKNKVEEVKVVEAPKVAESKPTKKTKNVQVKD